MPPPPADAGRMLLAVATGDEADAVAAPFNTPLPDPRPVWRLLPLDERFDLVITAVGKAAAAGAVARTLDPRRHAAVLNLGIAGALGATAVGRVVLADRCGLVDDGVLGPTGFEDLQSMGFGPFPDGTGDAATNGPLRARLRPLADVLGPIATVSLCSGTTAAAENLAARGYVAEAMEGAAGALVCAWVGVPFCELRVISNTTGDRASQVWRFRESMQTLTRVVETLRLL